MKIGLLMKIESAYAHVTIFRILPSNGLFDFSRKKIIFQNNVLAGMDLESHKNNVEISFLYNPQIR
jgi:hypothetical protein